MNNQDYEQKKKKCWLQFCQEKGVNQKLNISIFDAFDYIFDRAYALGKQEKDAEETVIVIQGWVARDSNESLYLFCLKPKRVRYLGSSDGVWMSRTIEELAPSLSPNLTWDSDPEPVEIIIKRKKK